MNDFVHKVSTKASKLPSDQLVNIISSISDENEIYDSILESLSTGLVIVNSDWECRMCNKAAERLLPCKSHLNDNQEGETLYDLIDDESISAFLKDCHKENKFNVSEEFSTPQGDSFRFEKIEVLPLVHKRYHENSDGYDNEILGFIIKIEDNTDSRRQEILLHRMESLASLTNLAASVAHEIKNPLGGISIHIQLLQKAIKKARASDGMIPDKKFMENYLDVINEEIDNLNKIVLDFLFAVRPLHSDMQLSYPDKLISKFADFFRPEFESKNVKIQLELEGQNRRLLLDEKLFREVILNLAQNALYAIEERMKKEDIDGCLKICSKVKDEKYFLVVSDNGSGMDEKTLSRIFEPYWTTKANGTGLGLTMVYKIIKEFKGDISASSVPDQGTVFKIILPLPQNKTMLLSHNKSEEKKEEENKK